MLETAAKRIKTSASLNQRPAKCWPSVFLGKDKYSATLCEKHATKDRTMSSILPGKAGSSNSPLWLTARWCLRPKIHPMLVFPRAALLAEHCDDRRDGYNKSVVAKSTKLMFWQASMQTCNSAAIGRMAREGQEIFKKLSVAVYRTKWRLSAFFDRERILSKPYFIHLSHPVMTPQFALYSNTP